MDGGTSILSGTKNRERFAYTDVGTLNSSRTGIHEPVDNNDIDYHFEF